MNQKTSLNKNNYTNHTHQSNKKFHVFNYSKKTDHITKFYKRVKFNITYHLNLGNQ